MTTAWTGISAEQHAEIDHSGIPGVGGGGGPTPLTVQGIAYENLSGHRAVLLYGDTVRYADNQTVTNNHGIIGVTTGAALVGAMATVQMIGKLHEPSWSWTPDIAIYLGAAGALTQVPPVAPAVFSLRIATAITATDIWIQSHSPIILI